MQGALVGEVVLNFMVVRKRFYDLVSRYVRMASADVSTVFWCQRRLCYVICYLHPVITIITVVQ